MVIFTTLLSFTQKYSIFNLEIYKKVKKLLKYNIKVGLDTNTS
jgi:hypothetical protein